MSFAGTDFTNAAINKMYLVITQENMLSIVPTEKPYKWIKTGKQINKINSNLEACQNWCCLYFLWECTNS